MQGVFFPTGAWEFPSGNFEDLTGNLTLIPCILVAGRKENDPTAKYNSCKEISLERI